MTHGSLFNGIGGFQLAAEWMGWENVFSCEIDEWCNKVTKKHFPNCIQHGDIKTTDFTIYRGRIDIITGGFPCQPFSVAGKRKGKEDVRYLWKEMLRAIREVEPVYVVAENVYGLLNQDNGREIGAICSDLENIGYEKPVIFDCTADSFDLPTLERHIWIITKTNGKRQERERVFQAPERIQQRQLQRSYSGERNGWDLPESRVLSVGKRIPYELDEVEAYGNSIPPKVAYEIFKTIDNIPN